MKRNNPKPAGFMLIVFSSIFIFLPGHQFYRELQFDRTPLRSAATIERTWTTRGGKGSVSYHAAYHYSIDGVTYHALRASVTASSYQRLQIGEVVPIRYLPQDFTQTRIDWVQEGTAKERNEEEAIGVGLVLMVIGVLILVFGRAQSSY